MCQHDLLLLRRYLDHGYIRTGSGPRPKPSTEIERIGKKDVRNGSTKYYSRQILLPESLQPYFAYKVCTVPPTIHIPEVVLLLGSRWKQTESNISQILRLKIRIVERIVLKFPLLKICGLDSGGTYFWGWQMANGIMLFRPTAESSVSTTPHTYLAYLDSCSRLTPPRQPPLPFHSYSHGVTVLTVSVSFSYLFGVHSLHCWCSPIEETRTRLPCRPCVLVANVSVNV